MMDWKKWKDSKMSLMDFILLNLVYQSSLSKLPFNLKDEVDEKLFTSLIHNQYVRNGDDKYYMAIGGINIFTTPKTNFETFFTIFPQKVPNNKGGDRLLRASSIYSKNGSEAYRKWKQYTAGSENKEKHLTDCLKAEVMLRTKQGDLPYMNNIITWFNQKKWEFYEYLLTEDESKGFNIEKSI